MGIQTATSEEVRSKKTTLDIMAPPTKEALKAAFDKADKDGTGKLSMKQFQAVMIELSEDENERKQAQTEGFVEMVMSAIDNDGDKMVSYEELLVLIGEAEVDDKQMLKNMVAAADKGGDGFLTAEELKSMCMKMDPEEDDHDMMINMIIRMCSTDGTCKVKAEEVVSYFIDGPKEKSPQEEAKMMFKMFDTNGDGYIDKKELVKYMKEMVCDEDDDDSDLKFMMKLMVASADEDEDGKLNYEEFTKMMGKK